MALRSFLVLAAIFCAGLCLSACQPQSARVACPAGWKCLEYGNSGDPLTLDPDKATTTTDAAIISEMIEGLIDSGPDGKPVPGIADHWDTSPDGLTWTFHLRDAKWSDGVPVTAGDFVYAYHRILDPNFGSPYAYMLYVLKNGHDIAEKGADPNTLGAKALDDHTLQLTLEHPAPYLLQIAKHQTFFPVPAHVVRKLGDDWLKPGNFVADGPYKLVSERLGDMVRLEKNPSYWDAANVCFNRVDFYPTTDTESAERRVKRGELDMNNTFTSRRIDYLRGAGGMKDYVHVAPYVGTSYLTYNVSKVKAFQDVRVRQALSMSIDRAFITSKLLRAGQTPTTSFVPPYMANYEPGAKAPWSNLTFPQRLAEARRLLAAAGYGPGHPLKIDMLVGIGSDNLLVPEALQADWKSVGVEMTVSQEEGQLTFQSLQDRDFQVSLIAWIADFDDPKTFLDLLKTGTGAQNYGDYSNPAYDKLLDEADNEPNVAKRAHLLREAEQIILDDAAVAPMIDLVGRNLVSPDITGWVDNEYNVHPVRYLCRRDAPPATTNQAA